MQKKQQANESISQLANKFEKEIKTTPSQCATVKALATHGWRGQV